MYLERFYGRTLAEIAEIMCTEVWHRAEPHRALFFEALNAVADVEQHRRFLRWHFDELREIRRHIRRLLGNRVPRNRLLPDGDYDEGEDQAQDRIVLIWGLVMHRVGQGTQDTSVLEQLVHDECQKKKEGAKFPIGEVAPQEDLRCGHRSGDAHRQVRDERRAGRVRQGWLQKHGVPSRCRLQLVFCKGWWRGHGDLEEVGFL
eukprot:1464463-Pyramimonas_sp.AAC.1